DLYTSLPQQYNMLRVIKNIYDRAYSSIKRGIPLSKVKEEGLFSDIIMMKYNISAEKPELFKELIDRINSYYDSLENMYKEGFTDEG
ncbi:MAG: V-type ATP synthase subunit A, partial [Atribacterota bacterium]